MFLPSCLFLVANVSDTVTTERYRSSPSIDMSPDVLYIPCIHSLVILLGTIIPISFKCLLIEISKIPPQQL